MARGSMRDVVRALSLPSGIVTLLRVPLGVAFALTRTRLEGVIVLCLAAVSDALDGALARKRHETTIIGAIADPIVDKWFAAWVLATLYARGAIDLSVICALATREIGLFFLAAFVLFRSRGRPRGAVKAIVWGKLTTAAQFAATISILVGARFAHALVAASAFFGALAAGAYALRELRAQLR